MSFALDYIMLVWMTLITNALISNNNLSNAYTQNASQTKPLQLEIEKIGKT